jgi:RNA polymerase sigma factor (sigma-70 family)
MAKTLFSPILHHVRRMVSDQRFKEASDEELLRQFKAGRDESAFHALLCRHGPMVLGVCRAVLRREADTEDAFQATFLALARKAGAIRKATSLSSWLYGVAYRTALKARADADARRRHEARLPGRSVTSPEDLTWGDTERVLYEELNALAERLRAPLVLCYLQGKTQDEAAASLGLTKATLKRRLEHGRRLLRMRLVRRGLGPAALLMASAWPAATASAVPAKLALSVARAASLFAAGPARPGLNLARTALGGGVLKTMLPANIKLITALLLVLATVGLGAAVLARQSGPGGEAAAPQDSGPAAEKDGRPAASKDRPARADVFGDPLPAGALMRMGTVRLRHNHPPMQLTTAFSADGKMLASGGWDEVRLWDTTTGKLLREIRDGNRTKSYCALCLAPDGRWLAGAGRESVCVWDTATGRRLHEFPSNGQSVACSSDGKLIATPSRDGSLRVWDMTTGKQAAHLRAGPSEEAPWPIFTPDGKGLVTLLDGQVYHWDLTEGQLRKKVALPIPAGYGLALAPDAQTLAITSRKGPTALWDLSTGKQRLKLEGELARGGFGLAFSPDGKTLATNATDPYSDDDATTVALWDAKSGEFLRRFRLPTRAVSALRFTPDGHTLLTTGSEPLLRLWDAATGKPVLPRLAHADLIRSVAFTPDGRSLVSGSYDGTVRLWDVASGRHERELGGHRGGVNAVAFTPDGKVVVSCGIDGCIRLQDRNGKELLRIPRAGDVLALGLAPDGKTAATWSRGPTGGGVFDAWDLGSGKGLSSRPDTAPVSTAPGFSPDGRLVAEFLYESRADGAAKAPAAGGGGAPPGGGPALAGLLLRELATGREVVRLRQTDGFNGLYAFAPDGRSLVTVTSRQGRRGDDLRFDDTLHFWELATGKERLTLACGTSSHWLQHVAYAPDGRTLAAARNDNTILFWDLLTAKELPHRVACDTPVTCLAFSPDSRSLASGQRDGAILLWDAAFAGGRQAGRAAKAEARQLEGWWDDLADKDARKANAAARELVAAPEQASRLFRDRLRPIREGAPDKLRQLIADLDSGEFETREAATKQLIDLGEGAGPALRAALKASPSAEQKKRIGEILDSLNCEPSGTALRQLRAVEVLELIGNDAARELLGALAKGESEARLTREAQATLERLARRPPTGP